MGKEQPAAVDVAFRLAGALADIRREHKERPWPTPRNKSLTEKGNPVEYIVTFIGVQTLMGRSNGGFVLNATLQPVPQNL